MRRSLARSVFAGIALLAVAPARAEVLVPSGAVWRYRDNGSNQGSAWRAPGFADGSWASGPAQLGYGDGDEATLVASGPSGAHFITTYFRHHFQVADPGTVQGLALRLLRDDGAVVYLNGTEIWRSNMAAGAVGYLTPASSAVAGADEGAFHAACLMAAGLLVAGDNVLAVEIHQSSGASSDISFDLELRGGPSAGPPGLLRGPYLQLARPEAVTVRWRTDAPADSRLRYGPAPDDLSQSISLPGLRCEHEVEVGGLAPATRTYYEVGTGAAALAGGDADHFFASAPPPGRRLPIRVWVVGDSGGANQDARDVRDAYLAFAGADLADLWLMLGDNAYETGTDEEYSAAVFGTYPQVLRNTVVWPSPGNHEFGASDSPSQSGPYYEAFSLPTQAEAGGVPSGTEAYYSFDHGNVHFIALDSHDTDRSVGGPMYAWLLADLQATDKEWLIAFWHHPPYSKGSHDSDLESQLIQMRERFVPLLEDYGVDLVLTGHSHSYERSILIDGHYGASGTFSSAHVVDGGDGDPDGPDGAYAKPVLVPDPHQGAVYSVVGSSAQNGGGTLDHPVMAVSIDYEGSLVLDVAGRQLDAAWIDKDGLVRDRFRILKGPELPACDDGLDNDDEGLVDYPEDPGCRNPDSSLEDPQCQDGINNDPAEDAGLDFDGGLSALGYAAGAPDPECSVSWKKAEAKGRRCGLGFELALLLPALGWLRGRRHPRPRHPQRSGRVGAAAGRTGGGPGFSSSRSMRSRRFTSARLRQ